MEKLKQVIILIAAGLIFVSFAADGKLPGVLLQEGIYAEETEGDLEKAIGIYEQIIAEHEENFHVAAKAAYQLGMCYLKKGDKQKAADYFQKVISDFPDQKVLVKKANEQLKEVRPENKESLFEKIDGQVLRFIAEKYGEIAIEAGQAHLPVNTHIYYVDPNFILYKGGLGSYYNWTGQTITGKVRLSGTSYPNQTHYDATGNKLKTEIVPDKTRPNHWQIYWIPDEPLAPEESLYYGWSMDNIKRLSQMLGEVYSLTMQNKFGSPVIETFFLVLPKQLEISQSNPPTGSEELLNFDIYWWTKTVQQGEKHFEKVQLKETLVKKYSIALSKPISVKVEKSPDGSRLSVQYAVIAIAEASGVPYQWNKSAQLAEPQRRNYIEPLHISDKTADQALAELLGPVGLSFRVDNSGLYLYDPEKFQEVEVLKSSKRDKMAAEDLTSQGWELWGQRKLAEAEEKFKQATEKDPTSDNAYQGLGWAQLNQGKKLNAQDSFEKCIKLNPKNSAALNGLGWIAHGQGNIDQAIEWWKKAVKASNGTATSSLSGLTQVYMDKKEYDKAIKYYRMWLKAEPDNKQAKEGLEKARELNED